MSAHRPAEVTMALEDLKDGGRVLPMTRWGVSVMHARTGPVTVFDEDLHTLTSCPDL